MFPELKLGAEPLKIGPIGVPPRKHEKFTMPGEWYDDEDERDGTEGGGEQEEQDKDDKKVSERRDEMCAAEERIIYPLETCDLSTSFSLAKSHTEGEMRHRAGDE